MIISIRLYMSLTLWHRQFRNPIFLVLWTCYSEVQLVTSAAVSLLGALRAAWTFASSSPEQSLKMPVWTSDVKIHAHTGLPTHLLHIIIPTSFTSLMCQKGQFTLYPCPGRWFVMKRFGFYPQRSHKWKFFIILFACPKRSFSRNCLSKRQAGWGPG